MRALLLDRILAPEKTTRAPRVHLVHEYKVCDALHDNLLTVTLCISKLKSGKRDGNRGFTSDHLLNSGKRLHILLTCRHVWCRGKASAL